MKVKVIVYGTIREFKGKNKYGNEYHFFSQDAQIPTPADRPDVPFRLRHSSKAEVLQPGVYEFDLTPYPGRMGELRWELSAPKLIAK